jgi:iron complex outermembrane receptor protein
MHSTTSRFAALMGSASFLTLISANAVNAQQMAQAQMAAAPESVPEQVLVTGSLIHGTAAVGVPVTNLGVQDFTQTGNITIGDLFRTVPEANVAPGPGAVNSGGHQERETRVNIRGLDQTGPRTLLMVDGIRFPPQADGLCAIDPSIIPALALDRVDILADGASATYGSDAIAGVINVILKRGYDGAVTLLHAQQPTDGGGLQLQASQLYGRTWQGGDITLTYEWTNENEIKGTVHSNYTANFTPWGLDNRIPINSAMPGIVSTGKPASTNGQGVKNAGTVCSNCYSIPTGTGANFNAALNGGVGPTGGSSAATLSWAQLLSHPGVTNEIDPLKQGWEEGAQQKNSLVGTFDQQIFPGVQFFFTGFYTNRRVQELLPPEYSQGVTAELATLTVPTTNPYYPTGAPAGLQVSYDFAHEVPPTIPAYELSDRYSFGFNVDLPFGWSGQIYDSRSYETAQYELHYINSNSVNIALGNTVSGSDALGNPVNNVTKAASIPYLNVFCDPTAFQCNSPKTLAYIEGTRLLGQHYSIEEKGARFDGPIPVDLPAGQIKVAIGGDYESDNVVTYAANNAGTVPAQGSVTQPALAPLIDSEPYNVWAVFTQVDIPIFGDNLNIPLVRKLDLEGSWRHDVYSGSLSGATSNPKVAFTWLIDEMIGATVRGSWGTSFRFANAGEFSTIASDANSAWNLGVPGNDISLPCKGGKPTAGSLAADLFAAGFACGSAPGGNNWAGGPHPELRAYTTPSGQAATREGGINLAPETSNNYSIGIELAPQIDFLRGLDLQATWYSVKVNGTLLGFNNIGASNMGNPAERFHFITPSDLGCPVAQNATPAACAPFETMVRAAALDRNSQFTLADVPNVYWLDDGSTVGTGFQHVSGVDFNASYDIDAGDLGAWNTGITGTYYLHRWYTTVNGVAPVDLYHTYPGYEQSANGLVQDGVALGSTGSGGSPQLVWRARLGWSNGPYSVTGFVNYSSHYYQGWPVPANVNFNCAASGGTVAGGTFPCAISNFTTSEPSFYTFDLSFGYNTGDIPASTYLKNLTIQLVIQNLMGIHAPFEYGPSTSTRNWAAYDINRPNQGRVIGITLIKNW